MNDCYRPISPFPTAQCSSSNYSGQNGPYSCRPHFPVLRKNYIEPAPRSPVIVELSDTQHLYIGQGILLGTTYYQITNIIDSLKVELQHNDLGATPGNLIVALHPEYGCFQQLVIPVGKVVIDTATAYAGLNAAGDTAIGGAIVQANINQIAYGYTGPTTVDFQAQITVQTANTPNWIAMALPVAARATIPFPAFAAFMDIGAGPVPAVAKLGVSSFQNHLIVGPGGGATIPDGSARVFSVSGKYEILL